MPDEPHNHREPLWGYDEVADYLGISPKTARKWAKNRKIPVVKVGRLNRFRPEAIRSWAREQERPVANGE